jgi:hypothetical protein
MFSHLLTRLRNTANNEYDAFWYEALVCEVFPGHGAIRGGMKGPIQNRADFERFPWDEIPTIFRKKYTPHFEAIRKVMPEGMKAYGGCGYGIFEASEDLVGYATWGYKVGKRIGKMPQPVFVIAKKD